jgi:hypothetical protein
LSAEVPKGSGEASSRVVPIPQQTGTSASASSAPRSDVAAEGVSALPHVVVEDEHLNTDERSKGQWESRYPPRAQTQIRLDALYVALVLILTLASILLTWRGTAFQLLAGDCTTCNRGTFERYAYFYLGGQLGGTLFGVKYLYNVVARGWWNIDRRLWRLFSPFLSAGLAVAVGALVDSGVFGLTTKATSGAAYFSLGFVAGYFADSALRKMKEIADTVFGSPEEHASHSAKSK